MQYHIKEGSEIILCGNDISDWERIWGKYEKDFIIKGIWTKDEVTNNFKQKRIALDQINESEKILLIGNKWKETAEYLEEKGYVFWETIYPEWGLSLIENEAFFKFEKVKKYTHNNIDIIADIFRYINQYKKIAAVFGNCQSLYLARILENTDVIKKEYMFCEFEFIQNMKEEKISGFDKRYMSYISLFIYQNVSKDNAFSEKLSTEEYVLKTLNSSAVKISIPFVYFNAYFPQYIRNFRNDDVRRGEGHTPYGDAKIQTLVEQGYTHNEIIDKLESDELFTTSDVTENLNTTINELEKREKICDIKILDYILANYRTQYLFYSPSHPTNTCLREVAVRILKHLGYSEFNINMDNLPKNDRVEMWIYQSVRKKLELTFPKNTFGFFRDLGRDDSLEQYVKKYIKYNFPEFSEELSRGTFRTINISHLLSINQELVSHRRQNYLTISGRTLHLGAYLTAECDMPRGTIIKIPSLYAPKYSYVTPVSIVNVREGGAFPCIIHSDGTFTIQANIRKDMVLMLDTTWNMK